MFGGISFISSREWTETRQEKGDSAYANKRKGACAWITTDSRDKLFLDWSTSSLEKIIPISNSVLDNTWKPKLYIDSNW